MRPEQLPRAPERARDNGYPGAPRFEYVHEPPDRFVLASVFVLVLVTLTLVGLGIWKLTELLGPTINRLIGP